MINEAASFSPEVLELDCGSESAAIAGMIRNALGRTLHKRGIVIGLSGGIDSSVSAALCVQAVGKDRVIGLQMPERYSSEDTMGLSTLVADHLGIRRFHIDITLILEAVGHYDKYDFAVRRTIPEYGTGWRSKIVISGISEENAYNVFSVEAASPRGDVLRKRLELESYLAIVASTNFKQRIRKMLEYYHADLHNYAVAGTPNRLEYDQGFFVKIGDGAADIKPIAHLYKTQVYQLARYMGLPETIINRPPTTDTYSLPQGQDEFYFSVPYRAMDLCLYGKNHDIPAEAVGRQAGLSPENVTAIYRDIDRKRASTRYLHLSPLLVRKIPEIDLGSATGHGSE
jgi:NAD+ synthase